MSMTIHVDIVSAEASIFSGLAEMVFAPGELGELGIAPRHAPLVTRLKPGEVRVNTGKVELDFFISGGIIEIQPHLVTVLADTAVRADDLDEAKALAAKKQAEEVLANKTSDIDFAKAQAELAEAAAQLQAISRLRKTR